MPAPTYLTTDILIELAQVWELQAATGTNGLFKLQAPARETLRACADLLRMMVSIAPQAPVPAPIAAAPAPGRDAMVHMVDAAMVEMRNITPPLRRSECERLIRAAIEAAQRDPNKDTKTGQPALSGWLAVAGKEPPTLDWTTVGPPGSLPATQLATVEVEAERWREIRRGQHWSVVNGIGDILRGDDLDAAVDAVRATRAKKGGA